MLRLAHDRGIYVVSDECYVYLNFTGHLFSAGCVHEVKERLIIIGSLSKTYAMTGWRLGYALGPAPIISAMQKLQSQSTSNPTSIVQKAAVTALTGSQGTLLQKVRANPPRGRAPARKFSRACGGGGRLHLLRNFAASVWPLRRLKGSSSLHTSGNCVRGLRRLCW